MYITFTVMFHIFYSPAMHLETIMFYVEIINLCGTHSPSETIFKYYTMFYKIYVIIQFNHFILLHILNVLNNMYIEFKCVKIAYS